MRRSLFSPAVVAALLASASVGFGQAKPPSTPSLEGVWENTSVISTRPNAANSIQNRPFNINIWTKKYMSRLVADGPARPVLAPPKDPAKLTDEEKLARY
jgi:hypothetical protein